MKTCILIVLTSFVCFCAKAQTKDSTLYGDKNYRAVMGSGEKVLIDSITPLPKLIKKLETPWEFTITGKGYWIGYTDDMYSIARYQDKAIEQLIILVDTSKNLKARKGALYTIHLIGINFRVVGRFDEHFENKNARNALLKYLEDSELNETVVFLLMRDPWLSDLPKYMDYLAKPGRDYSKVLSALQRYDFEGKPFRQKVTNNTLLRKIEMKVPNHNGNHYIYELILFQKELAPHFVVDRQITESAEWRKSINELSAKGTTGYITNLDFFFGHYDTFSFCMFNELNYTFSNNQINIYSPTKARQIWLDWWNGLSLIQKETLFLSNHISN